MWVSFWRGMSGHAKQIGSLDIEVQIIQFFGAQYHEGVTGGLSDSVQTTRDTTFLGENYSKTTPHILRLHDVERSEFDIGRLDQQM